MDFVFQLISQYGLIALFFLLVLGIVGLPVPDETLLTFCGYLVYKGNFHYLPTVLVAFAGSVCGITTSYIIGRTGGLYLVHKYGRYVHLTQARLDAVHMWFERMGRWTLFFGYFMPGVRHFTAVVAGSSELEPHVFALFAYSGGFFWVLTFISLGYFLGEQWSHITEEIHTVLLGITGVIVAAAIVYWLIWRRKKKRI
jgi:membrane protein DedA with SNARE-associated domain